MAATSMAVEMLKLLLLLLLLLLEDAKSSWDSESRDASFTAASIFFGEQTRGVSYCCTTAVPAAAAVASGLSVFSISSTTATQ